MIPPKIKDVLPMENFLLKITYTNGEKRIYDMKKNFNLNFFKNLKNFEYFKLAKSEETTITWPQGEDIDQNDL